MGPARKLRRDWSYRRSAVVLTGGGALGAYQVGVLRALEAVGLRPGIVAGLSVGAIHAVAWVAGGLDSTALERIWRRIGPSSIGMRWNTLTLRAFGLFLTALAGLEILLTVAGSDELVLARRFLSRAAGRAVLPGLAFDLVAWTLVGMFGWALARLARRVDDAISRTPAGADPRLWQRVFGALLLAFGALHVATWWFDWTWPHRFSATVLVLGCGIWLLNQPGAVGVWLRTTLLRVLPESGGRGLWRGLARRRLLDRLTNRGRAARLQGGGVRLMMNAVAMASGRMSWFVNAPPPGAAFRAEMEEALADVVELRTPREVLEAAVASSAIPLLFEPVRIRGRDYVDAGMFSSRALHAVIADGADAILVVLLSPPEWRLPERSGSNLLEVGARLLELGSWRDLRLELRGLPPPWSSPEIPARVCVVEPAGDLPGHLLGFDPGSAAALIARGEADAWSALERAGWLAPA